MKPVKRIIVAIGFCTLITQGCLNPNAYQEYEKSYGYSSRIAEDLNRANQGYVSFIAGKDIDRRLLRWHCLRRVAELCEERNLDYFRILSTSVYDTTTKEYETRYWGSYTDTYGNKYNKFKTNAITVPALKQHMAFQGFRGPIPVNLKDYAYYPVAGVLKEYHRGMNGRNLDLNLPAPPCAACGASTKDLQFPEHCPACGKFLLAAAQCPHCFEEAGPWTQGLVECGECESEFRNASCPHCNACQTLLDSSPFKCAICNLRSETGVESGKEEFKCPHCKILLGWPEELFGEYECKWCAKVFIIQQCERCQTPHALQEPMSFTCWGCSRWIAQGR